MNRPNLLTLLAFLLAVCSARAQQNMDSVLGGIKLLKGTAKVDELNKVSRYFIQSDFEKSLGFAREAYDLADLADYRHGKEEAIFNMAVYYHRISRFDTSVQLLDSLSKLKTGSDPVLLSQVCNTQGLNWLKLNQHYVALQFFIRSLQHVENHPDPVHKAKPLNNIGLTYMELNQHQKAIDNFHRALKLFREGNNTVYWPMLYANIAASYGALGHTDSVLYYAGLAAQYAEKNGDIVTWANSLSILSKAYEVRNDLPKALELLEKARDLRLKVMDPYYVVSDFILIAEQYLRIGEIKKAEQNALLALNLLDSSHVERKRMDVYHILARVYEAGKDYSKSAEYYRLWGAEKDSVYSKASSQAFAEMETKYESAKKEKENLQLQRALERNRYMIISLILLAAVIALAGVLVISRTRLKQKAILAGEKQVHEQLRFRSVIEAEEKERSRMARDLHDGLGQMLATAKLNMASLDESVPTEDRNLLETSKHMIDDAVKEVRNISHNLMPGTLLQLGLEAAIMEAVRKVNNSGKIEFQTWFETGDERYPVQFEITLYRIFQEILNNILKHSGADKISLRFGHDVNGISMMLQDNGKGFDPAIIENSTGLGWKNIQFRVGLLNGILDVNSAPGKGSRIQVIVPVPHENKKMELEEDIKTGTAT